MSRGVASTAVRELKVLFFGTDEFAARALVGLNEGRYTKNSVIEHIELVCPPTLYKRKGKKDAISWRAQTAQTANTLHMKVHNPPDRVMSEWEVPEIDAEDGGGRFDIGVVASFGRILSPRIVESFPLGMINVHPSLLPKYRGPSPIQTAILNDDKVTGVTVQELHPTRVDAGRILAQMPYKLTPSLTRLDLMFQLGYLGGVLAGKVLQNLSLVRKQSIEQDDRLATSTKMFSARDTHISWETMTAMDIMRMHRAHFGHEPVYSHLRIKNKHVMIKLLDLELAWSKRKPLVENYLDMPPGSLLKAKKVPYIEIPCIGGGRIHVSRFCPAGKMHVDGYQFNAGYLKKSREARLVSTPTDTKYPPRPFEYPPDYKRPTLEEVAADEAAYTAAYAQEAAEAATDMQTGMTSEPSEDD
ncbi:Methionyl-tRNA formyltransferase [Coemansia biformis]|uniref:methionyl-tRNA formyltransferase n=1 Tax=Coemansia biformis TaxID=1286918 RepID=A0A9W7YEX5_9FUNG|nr:Methionyl-tRNA formyltransferase [Coemansia biformis]